MKIRTGFISNSSTSSFIVKGFVIPREKINKEKLIEIILTKYPEIKEEINQYDEDELSWNLFHLLREKRIYITDCEEDGAPYDCYLIGEQLQDTGSEGYLNDQIIDCNLDEILLQLQKILVEITEEKPTVKVVVGTRCC